MLHLEQHRSLPSIDEVLLNPPSVIPGKIELAPLRRCIMSSPAPSPLQPIHPSSLSSLNCDYKRLPFDMKNLDLSPSSPAVAEDHDHQQHFYHHRRSRSETFTALQKEDPLRINCWLSPPSPPSSCTPSLKRSASQPQKRYTCHYCQKGFIRPSSLLTHTYSHTGQKPFMCTFEGCHKRFSVLSNMRRHMRRHHDTATPANCDTSSSIPHSTEEQ